MSWVFLGREDGKAIAGTGNNLINSTKMGKWVQPMAVGSVNVKNQVKWGWIQWRMRQLQEHASHIHNVSTPASLESSIT